MIKNYYTIIGTSRDASQEDINRAYRKAIWRVHPDVSHAVDAERFLEIQEAYEVLSDPERRRIYDAELKRSEGPRQPTSHHTVVGRTASPEPLVPEPISVTRDFDTLSDPFDSLLERFFRNFTGLGIPKAERPESLTLELILSPDEALRGGRVTFNVPVLINCPFCDGTGREWPFTCTSCYGRGSIEEEKSVTLDIPSRIRSGSVYEFPLSGFGVHNLYLRVFVRVGSPQ
jgi:DnaJ-class molecular chaperone